MRNEFLIIGLIALFFAAGNVLAKDTPAKDLIVISHDYENIMRSNNMPYIWKSPDYLLAEWDNNQQMNAKSLGIAMEVIVTGIDDSKDYYIIEGNKARKLPLELKTRTLYQQDRQIIIQMDTGEAEAWVDKGYHIIKLEHKDNFWQEKAQMIPFTCTYNATVADLLSRTNVTQWTDWIEKLTGVESVVIGGTTYTVRTRYTDSMFNGNIDGHGYDFVLQTVQSMHYGSNIEEDPYGTNRKNIILTIPGQTTPSEIVGACAHLDDVPSSGVAPGADDNASGSVMLLEAARLFRQFRFQRTVKIMFFTGEEQGLLGSAAYVADHPTTNYLGVIDGDMLSYDSIAQKRYEIHAGTMTSSQDVGHCVQDTDAAYDLGLTDSFITSGSSTGSDHASFWNVNVGAIMLAEYDFTPYYHTANDTLANIYPNFGTDLTKAALGALAAMAIPIEACFTTTPILTAFAGDLQVNLSWTSVAGASSYRVFRSTQGCQGQWFEQTSTTQLSWIDTDVNINSTYYYYVEAVASDGFCVSNMSNCQSVTVPICTNCAIYHTGSNILVGNPSDADNDAYPDNCETATARVTIDNVGTAIAQNVQIYITSVDNFIAITTPMPIVISSIPVGGSADTQFTYTIGMGTNKATCMQTGAFDISVQAQGQSNPSIRSFTFIHEADSVTATKTYAFEPATGLEGWTVQSGTWALSTARVNPGGSTRSVHSSQNQNNRCDIFVSPTVQIDSTATDCTLTIPNWYAIQTQSSGSWRDRANVHIIDVDAGGTRTLVSPSSGKLYATGTFYNAGSTCSNTGTEAGWAGNTTADMTWGNSVFNLNSFIGKNIRIEIKYYTDGSTAREGVYVDDISITNIKTLACDSYSDICPTTNDLAGRITNTLYVAKSGTNLNLTWTAPPSPCVTTAYGVYRGNLPWTSYNHSSLSCAVTTNSYTTPSDTSNYYFLVVAQNADREGSYGKDSFGTERPSASSPCLLQEISTCN